MGRRKEIPLAGKDEEWVRRVARGNQATPKETGNEKIEGKILLLAFFLRLHYGLIVIVSDNGLMPDYDK